MFDFSICDNILDRVYRPYHFIDDDHFVFLIFCLIKKFTLRPDRRAGDKRNIVSPFGKKFTRNKRILLRPAKNQSSYNMYDFQKSKLQTAISQYSHVLKITKMVKKSHQCDYSNRYETTPCYNSASQTNIGGNKSFSLSATNKQPQSQN
jgi:hypothetical protein